MHKIIFLQFRQFRLLVLMCAVCVYSTRPVQAVNDEKLEEFGDVMQFALPAIGLGAAWGYGDKEGAKQWHGLALLLSVPPRF